MDITVRNILNLQKKESIYQIAKELDIPGRSSLNKTGLIDAVTENLLMQDTVQKYMLRFSEKQYQIFTNGMDNPLILQNEQEKTELQELQRYGYVFVDGMTAVIPPEVKSIVESLNADKLNAEHNKVIWLRKCIRLGMDIYGIMTEDLLEKMFNSQPTYHMPMEEVTKLYIEYSDLFPYCRFGSGVFIPAETSLEELRHLLNRQNGRKYYIAGRQEIEDYAKNSFLSGNSSYQKMYSFLLSDTNASETEAKDILHELWGVNTSGKDVVACIGEILEKNHFPNANSAINFIRYALDTYNNTRQRDYRGYTPLEMKRLLRNTNGTVTVFGRNEEMSAIKALTPILEQKGFYIGDVQEPPRKAIGSAEMKLKKIYPNDPCPCGSGLKYKKCCGKY